MVPAFDAGLTRSRAAPPPKWDRDRLTTRMPRRMRAYNTQARRRSPDNIRSITCYLVENRTHAMFLVRPSRTLERYSKNGRCVTGGFGGRAVSAGTNWQASAGPYRAG